MKGVSIIVPMDKDRTPLFFKSLDAYNEYGIPEDVEFIIVSRTITTIGQSIYPLKLIRYEHKGEHFNPALALNIGVKSAKYDNIIITCPEVMPLTNVLSQLKRLKRGNYMCQVFDQTKQFKKGVSLVNSKYRCGTPSMYFLAMFKKEDLETINGFDEDFMQGLGYEDTEFGQRFVNAGLKFECKDYIKALHLYHKRVPPNEGYRRNGILCEQKKENKWCENGLIKR